MEIIARNSAINNANSTPPVTISFMSRLQPALSRHCYTTQPAPPVIPQPVPTVAPPQLCLLPQA